MQGSKNSRLPEQLLLNARELRQSQTDAEALIWALLRRKNLGVKFKRQHVVLGYIVDFYYHEHKLAIELDGGQHIGLQAQDAERTRCLSAEGIKVLRFWNNDVLLSTESALTAIWNEMTVGAGSPLPNPPSAPGHSPVGSWRYGERSSASLFRLHPGG